VELLTDFNQILDDLENIEVKLKDEDKALLLLSTLHKTYKHFKDTLFENEKIITLEEVQTSKRTKEFQKFQESKRENNELSLNVDNFFTASAPRCQK